MISILGDYSYTFPQPIPLKLKLKDMLEDNVDEKYYLSDKMIQGMMTTNTILTRYEKNQQCIQIKNATKQGYLEATDGDGIDISSRMEYHRGNVQKDKIQILTTSGGNDRGVVTACAMRGREGKQQIELSNRELANTITTVQKDSMVSNNLRIRKLTPRECGRLMNVKDEDITNMLRNQSNSSAYHCFGDSICTNVLMAVFGELLDIDWKTKLNEL